MMNSIKFALAAFVVTVVISEAVGQFTCRGFPDGLYADPKNCTKFYQCMDAKLKYSLSCAHKSPEDFFDRDDEKCVLPANHLTQCTIKGKRLPYGGEGAYTCPSADYKLYEHPSDCMYYWECNKGAASVKNCNGGMFFSAQDTNPFGGKCVNYPEMQEHCSVRGKRYTDQEKEDMKNTTPKPTPEPTSDDATDAKPEDVKAANTTTSDSTGDTSPNNKNNGAGRLFAECSSVLALIAVVFMWH